MGTIIFNGISYGGSSADAIKKVAYADVSDHTPEALNDIIYNKTDQKLYISVTDTDTGNLVWQEYNSGTGITETTDINDLVPTELHELVYDKSTGTIYIARLNDDDELEWKLLSGSSSVEISDTEPSDPDPNVVYYIIDED